ncbi:MAG: hypothetical protein ACR2JD_04705 [Nocardioides sp.]
MATRSVGAFLASALVGALLATIAGAPAQAATREDTCFGEKFTIKGKPGQTVLGTPAADVILGGGRVEAGAGDDLVCDADYVFGGPGADRIRMLDGGTARGNGGDDEFISLTTTSPTALGPTLIGGPGDDVFWGSPLGEKVLAGSGADVARTGGGDDVVDLGSGDDLGYGGPDADTFTAGTGDDDIDGGSGADVVDGGPDADTCLDVETRTSCARVR